MSELTGPAPTVFDKPDLAPADILALDRLAAAAWPAPRAVDLEGWQLRFADGVSRRANSVAPFPGRPSRRPLANRVAEVEIFYKTRGLPPRFQISPAAEPDDLEAMLTARGYGVETPVRIKIARPRDLVAAGRKRGIRVSSVAPAGWWDVYLTGFGRDARSIVARARDEVVYAWAPGTRGSIDAIGLGVFGGGWLGVFAMFTLTERRGQGLGRNILAALADGTVARDGHGLYLQVEEDNRTALGLYAGCGFRAVYGYHYRTLWT